jgi:hypothetical protein
MVTDISLRDRVLRPNPGTEHVRIVRECPGFEARRSPLDVRLIAGGTPRDEQRKVVLL